VILIGEIRDREDHGTRHRLRRNRPPGMGTLHANNANQAIDRIINFFPEERRPQLLMDLSLNLKAIVSQRLIPVKEGKGRAAAVEVLLNSPLIADLIFKGEVHGIKEIMKKSKELGMQTFDMALFDLFEEGRISYDDALRFADSMNEVRLMIKLHSKQSQEMDRPGSSIWTLSATPASSISTGGGQSLLAAELQTRLTAPARGDGRRRRSRCCTAGIRAGRCRAGSCARSAAGSAWAGACRPKGTSSSSRRSAASARCPAPGRKAASSSSLPRRSP
jgi:hypothetical protein